MNIKTLVCVGGALSLGVAGLSAADIVGKVTFKGTQPAERVLPLDPQCGKLHPNDKPTTRFYVVGSGGELADVFVSLDGITGKSKGPTLPPAVLDQKGCEYVPYVMAIQSGQMLKVKNSDPLLHNVHPTPKPGTKNKEANRAQLPNSPDLEFLFPDAEEFLRFKCDVHPWMLGFISVFDHAQFAVTDETGSFTIYGLSEGTHLLEVWHESLGTQTLEVTVQGDETTVGLEYAE